MELCKCERFFRRSVQKQVAQAAHSKRNTLDQCQCKINGKGKGEMRKEKIWRVRV